MPPPLARPGGRRHLHGLLFKTLGGVGGHRPEPPELLAGLRVIGGHIAACRAAVSAAMTDNDFFAEHARRAADEAIVPFFEGHYAPQLPPAFRVERDQAAVLRARVDLAAPPGDAPAAPTRSEEPTSELQSPMPL